MGKSVTILTGFLGAGKSILLNSIISNNKTIRFGVIENEFGSEGIDGELIISRDNPLIELNDGCICCSIKREI